MMRFNLLNLFSQTQLIILCVVLAIALSFLVVNLIIRMHYKKTMKRQLCTKQLQEKRLYLLSQLEALRTGQVQFVENENHEYVEASVAENDPLEETESMETSASEEEEPFDPFRQLQILKVEEMSPLMRENFNLMDAFYDTKSFYVRYNYSFEAKLRASDETVKKYFEEILTEISTYKGLKYQKSARHVRVYKGLKTLALIQFRGKTLCMAFALDPQEYAETKYRGRDMSHIKRYQATPMLLRLTSKNKKEYAKYLLLQLADLYSIPPHPNPKPIEIDLEHLELPELYERKLLQISVYSMVEENNTFIDLQSDSIKSNENLDSSLKEELN